MISSRTLAPTNASTVGPAGFLRRAWTLLGRELRLRRDLQHLERLDDAELADLGLTRGAIEGAVRGRFDPRA